MRDFRTLDDLLKEAIPDYDEYILRYEEKRITGYANSRKKFLSYLKEYYPNQLHQLNKKQLEFLLSHCYILYRDVLNESLPTTIKPITYNYTSIESITSLEKHKFEESIPLITEEDKKEFGEQISFLHNAFQKVYKEGMKKWVYEGTYRLYDLITKIDVFKFGLFLKKQEPEQYKTYLKMFIHLRHQTPIEPEEPVYIFIEDEEVYGYLKDKPNSYAIEFNPWNEWLSYFISPLILDTLDYESILYFCLWEMSFVSFDELEIQNEFNQIIKQIDDFTNKDT